MSTPLRVETHRYHVVRTRLLERWPEVDAETLADTLEGITDLHEMIAAVIRSALVDEALQAGLRSRLEEMRQRLARLEERSTKTRQCSLDGLCYDGPKKVEQPDFTASARSGMSPLLVLAGNLIPEPYWVPQPPKLDRQTLLADLKRGDVIPGAQLGNPQPCLAVTDQMTAFTDAQVKSLEDKLDAKHGRTRRVQDTTLSYVVSWHVIADA